MTLYELWIITHDGEDLFYFTSDTKENPKKQLSNNFIQGVHKVAQELGGGKYFTLESTGNFILGKDYKHKTLSVYIVGVFRKAKKELKKKYELLLDTLEQSMIKLSEAQIKDRGFLTSHLTETIKKIKIAT